MTAVTHKLVLVPVARVVALAQQRCDELRELHDRTSTTMAANMYQFAVEQIDELIAAIEASPSLPSSSGISEAMRDRIVKVLEPFAELARYYPGAFPEVAYINTRDLRAARSLLSELTAPISDKETT